MGDVDVVVIGAGNAGLTAAATLQRGGARTLLVERHNVPGGCATSFRRGRFEFETALHQLSGVGEPGQENSLRALFADLGVADKLEFVRESHLYRAVVPGVLDVTLPADWEGAVDALAGAFPGDRDRVAGFLDLCRRVATWRQRAEVAGEAVRRPLRLFGKDLLRHGLRPARQVLDEHFDDPRVGHVLAAYWAYLGQPPATMPFQDLAMLLYLYLEYGAYLLRGGSQTLSTALLDAYLAAGGRVRFNTAVERIRTHDGAVRGVRLSDGEEVTTDEIVSNASPVATYLDMLDPADVPDAVRDDLSTRRIGVSAVALHLGLDATAAELGFTSSTNFIGAAVGHRPPGSDPTAPAGSVCVTSYDLAPIGFAPPGASHVSLLTLQYADAWAELSPEAYQAAKFAYAGTMLDLAERMTPGLRDVIEEVEVATPVTFARYLGHPGGAIYGYDQDAAGSWQFGAAPVEAVRGLHFAGAWAGPGGFQPTLESGARLARRLLHRGPA